MALAGSAVLKAGFGLMARAGQMVPGHDPA